MRPFCSFACDGMSVANVLFHVSALKPKTSRGDFRALLCCGEVGRAVQGAGLKSRLELVLRGFESHTSQFIFRILTL